MTKFSQSPERMTFQKEGYVKRQEERGEPVNEEYLDYFEKVIDQHDHRFDDPASRVRNLEWDLLTTEWILEKVRTSETYAQNLYAAMCNNDFTKREMWPILKEEKWSCSWRYAGGIVADMRQEGDYIDYYCSGIRGGDFPDSIDVPYEQKKFVPESVVTEEIEADLYKLGWIVIKDEE
jgi:hypothetical protein